MVLTSNRERTLWVLTGVVLVAIYSTLGPAQSLAQELREHNLLRLTLGIVALGLLLYTAWRFFRTRPQKGEIAVGFFVLAVYFWAWARVETPEERTHLIEYSLVAVLIHKALLERRENGRHVPRPAWLALFAAIALGTVDEGLQAVLPHRHFDLRDLGFNVLAAVMAIGARQALVWIRKD